MVSDGVAGEMNKAVEEVKPVMDGDFSIQKGFVNLSSRG